MPVPPVLLSSYATRVISSGTGVLSSLSPFRGCLSGSSELGWGSVELLRTSAVRVFFSECTLCPGLGQGSSISVSFWLRMPWSRGCWLSVTKRSVLCPLGSVHLCCRSVSSLRRTCCHPGGRVWVWRSRSSLRGFCFGAVVPWFLATFYWFCGWRSGTWVDPVLLAWTYHCFRLGDWSLGLASSSVACHPSPSHGLARLGGSCMSPHFEMLSVLFPGNIGSHFLGISRSFCGNV